MHIKDVLRKYFSVVALGIALSGCGSTSNLVAPGSRDLPDLSKYTKVVVLDFENQVTKKVKDEKKQLAYTEGVNIAGKNFADRIAAELKKTGVFESVDRAPDLGEALTISGGITRFEEGNSTARFWIGMGAGSSYFDADVAFKEQLTQKELGKVRVDKNSWWLGGGLASGQTVEAFMQAAAQKIAQQVKKAKTGGK